MTRNSGGHHPLKKMIGNFQWEIMAVIIIFSFSGIIGNFQPSLLDNFFWNYRQFLTRNSGGHCIFSKIIGNFQPYFLDHFFGRINNFHQIVNSLSSGSISSDYPVFFCQFAGVNSLIILPAGIICYSPPPVTIILL